MDSEIEINDSTTGAENACADALMDPNKKKSSQDGVKSTQITEEKNGSDEKMDTDEKQNSSSKELEDKEKSVNGSKEGDIEDCDVDSKHSETLNNHHESNTISDVPSSLINNTDFSEKLESEINPETAEICGTDSENKSGKLDKDANTVTETKSPILNGSPADVNNEEPMDVDSSTSVPDLKEQSSSSVHSDSKERDLALDNISVEEKSNSDGKTVLKEKEEPSIESSKEKDVTLPKNTVSLVEKVVSVGMSPETIVADDSLTEKTNVEPTNEKKDTEKKNEDSSTNKVEAKNVESTKSKDKETKESGKKKKSKTCEECGVKKGLKLQLLFQGKTRFLCSDTCFNNFKSKQKKPAEAPQLPTVVKCAQCQKVVPDGQGYYPNIGEVKTLCSEECIKKYHDIHAVPKKCSECKKVLDDPKNFDILTWETMLFCNEDCLGKYQSFLGSHCTCCQTPVQQASLGKYCVCFGSDIRQFCSGSCLEEFKKGLKVCSFCQTDLSAGTEGFLAPVGDKGQFKDFCSQRCMERYEIMNNINTKNPPEIQDCAYCKKQGTHRIQMKQDEKTFHFCCDLCIAGYRCANKMQDDMCDTCYKTFKVKPEEDLSLKLEGMHRHFCTKACMTLFVLSHRKIVPCVWCKVKKYNFDMIEKIEANNLSQMFCSLNCLSLYRVSLNAASAKSIRCDNCSKTSPAQYHLTMSDGSIRNFCQYQCVLIFQNQFTNVPALTTSSTTRQTANSSVLKTTSSVSTPVISNVISLASSRPSTPVTPVSMSKLVPQKLIPVRQHSPIIIAPKSQGVSSTITSPSIVSTASGPGGAQIIREVIVKPPAPKSVKNKTVSCKPIMQTKGVSCKPHPCHKAVQTDDSPRPIFLPIPVPIYVPTPVHMFSRPVPCPVPFPVPIPIPIIVPSAKEASSQIINHLKDIQEKTPSNPLEAELLKMAEMVAEDDCMETEKEHEKTEAASTLKSEDSSSKNAVGNSMLSSRRESPSLEIFEEKEGPDKEESEPEDEYVFKETKTHRKRSVVTHSSHGKRRRKSRGVDIPSEEDSSNVPTTVDDQNAAKENDKPKGPPQLKVP